MASSGTLAVFCSCCLILTHPGYTWESGSREGCIVEGGLGPCQAPALRGLDWEWSWEGQEEEPLCVSQDYSFALLIQVSWRQAYCLCTVCSSIPWNQLFCHSTKWPIGSLKFGELNSNHTSRWLQANHCSSTSEWQASGCLLHEQNKECEAWYILKGQ